MNSTQKIGFGDGAVAFLGIFLILALIIPVIQVVLSIISFFWPILPVILFAGFFVGVSGGPR